MHKEYGLKEKELPFAIRVLINVISIILIVCTIKGCLYFYYNVYKAKERAVVKKVNYAYRKIQDELTQYYKTNGYVYSDPNSLTDNFCIQLGEKYTKHGAECVSKPNVFGYQKNFTFDGTKIEVWGMDTQARIEDGTLVKEFFIDADGEKGANEFGIDRIPLKIYSSGRLGGLLIPVNCSKQHEEEYGFVYSKMCSPNVEINYLDTNKYFGFDIYQIGGDQGKTRTLNRNVSFLRADCIAFGGELIAQYEYCDIRMYPWLPACYDEFPCAVEIAKEKY